MGNWLSAPVVNCGYTNMSLSSVLHKGQRSLAAHFCLPGQIQFVARQAAIGVYGPIPRIGKREAAEPALVISKELLDRRHFAFVQIVEPDAPAIERPGKIAIPLLRAVQETKRLVLKPR